MKKLISVLIISILSFALVACTVEAQSTSKTDNPEISVGFMFEHEGCRVFRFYDAGRANYFVKCDNGKHQTIVAHAESNGKTQTVHSRIIPTN